VKAGFNATEPSALEISLAMHGVTAQGISHVIDVKINETIQIPMTAFSVEIYCKQLDIGTKS
jgi:hypothetical protein